MLPLIYVNNLITDCKPRSASADPESYVRGSKLDNFVTFFLVYEGIEDPNNAVNGPSSACQ